MKVLKLILQQVLFFLLAIMALNLQATNNFKFVNKKNNRHTEIKVEKIKDEGRYYLRVYSETRLEGGSLIINSMRMPLKSSGTGGELPTSESGEEQDGQHLVFSLLTRELLIRKSQTGHSEPCHILMPFGFFADGTIRINGLLRNVTVLQNISGSDFAIHGYLSPEPNRSFGLELNEEQDDQTSVHVIGTVAFNPDDGQLTRFDISPSGHNTNTTVNFRGVLQPFDRPNVVSEQGYDGQNEGAVASDGNQDKEGIKDDQPDDSRPFSINIPANDLSLVGGLQSRTPADQLDSRTSVLGSVEGAGAWNKGDTGGHSPADQ
ncbi:hypothetical protein [Endozoicomonas euniceicola]|uniref:Uncharacterized protein n=1 Tax=Endozoicomonas euniceicola TaxID=1234143 RepID=A0ABY6GMX2_9GAMM|nr:hypothetical protein [Endozoicomonas euniceicola]UYM14077.1 hypothetical protein NX720_14285 [Endozoicomonas euniceicola]